MATAVSTPGLTEDLLNSVRQLSTPELKALCDEVSMLYAERKAPHLSRDESRLFHTINAPLLPLESMKRYRALKDRRDDGVITAPELEELIRLTELMETNNVPRIQAVIELAQLRHTTPEAIMESLGIVPK